jgi:hypothetical protein
MYNLFIQQIQTITIIASHHHHLHLLLMCCLIMQAQESPTFSPLKENIDFFRFSFCVLHIKFDFKITSKLEMKCSREILPHKHTTN